jgi:hypothetical protein
MPHFKPFDQFITETRTARAATPSSPGYAVGLASRAAGAPRGVDELEKMKDFILKYYNNGRIRVTKSYLLPDGNHVDCIPFEEQPALRGLPAEEVAGARTPPSYDGPTAPPAAPAAAAGTGAAPPRPVLPQAAAGTTDAVGNTRTLPEGSVAIPRLTLERLTQFSTLPNFFRKLPWRGRSEMEQRARTANAPIGAFALDSRYHSHAAHYGTPGVDIYTGAGTWMSVWAPNPGQSQFSLSQLWIVATDPQGAALQTIEGGWIVSPGRYPESGGKPVLFIFMTANGYGVRDNDPSQSGWNGYLGNMNLPGDVTAQTYFALSPNPDPRYHLGQPLDPQSSVGGVQFGFRMQWQRHPQTMDWWLFLGGGDPADMHPFGCILARYFRGGPLVQPNVGANVVDFGGEQQNIQQPPAITQSAAPIGSGRFPAEGFPNAAFQKLITAETTGGTVPAELDPHTPQDAPASFYQVKVIANDPVWGSSLFYGGPGSGG